MAAVIDDAAPARAERRQADRRRHWDAFVAGNAGDLNQLTAWGAAKEATGFSTVLATVDRDGAILGGAQIVVRRVAGFVGIGYVARGPLIRPGASDADVAEVLDAVERQARRQGVWHLVVQPAAGGEAVAAKLLARGYFEAPDVSPRATMVIDLRRSEDEILAGMSPSRRRNVRQAQQNGLEIGAGSRDDIDRFHELHAVSGERQGFRPLPKTYLRAQWDALRPAGAVELVTASHAGRIVAGIWLTRSGGTVTYRIPGWNGEAAKLQPNVACHWYAMRWARQQGDRWYDLGGIDRRHLATYQRDGKRPAHDPQSPAAFKLGFGGEPLLLPGAVQRTLHPLLRPIVRAGFAGLADSRLLRAALNRLRGA